LPNKDLHGIVEELVFESGCWFLFSVASDKHPL
jgi:hypothetical protein